MNEQISRAIEKMRREAAGLPPSLRQAIVSMKIDPLAIEGVAKGVAPREDADKEV